MPKNVYGQELIPNPNVQGAWIVAPETTATPTPAPTSTPTPAPTPAPAPYTPNYVSMRTPTGTIATVDVNSDAYKQNLGGAYTGYSPVIVEAPAATKTAADLLASQNKATESFANQTGSELSKMTVTPTSTTTTKVETEADKKLAGATKAADENKFLTEADKKLAEATKAADENKFLSDLDKAYMRIQNGVASDIDKTNVARAIQQGKYTPSSPIKDPVTLQRINSYIGPTQYAKLKASYTPYQLSTATYRDANGDIFFRAGYNSDNINQIPRTDPKITDKNTVEKIISAIESGISDGKKEKDDYTRVVDDKDKIDDTTDDNNLDTTDSNLMDAAKKVSDIKTKMQLIDEQIEQIKKDIKKEVEGEANESYITALTSVRAEDILKQKRLLQIDYDNALNEYNALNSEKKIRDQYDFELLKEGYERLTSTDGVDPSQYITIGGLHYKKPKTTYEPTSNMKDYLYAKENGYKGSFIDFINSKDVSYQMITDPVTGKVIGTFNPSTGTISNIETGTGGASNKIVTDINGAKYDFTGYAADDTQAQKVQNYVNQIGKLNNVADVDALLKQNGVTNITGKQVVDAANKYGVSWEVMLGLMAHESLLGQSNVAKNNNNFGGITWSQAYQDAHPGSSKGTARPASEGGYYVKFKTVQDGLNALAELLNSKYKIKENNNTTKTELSDVAKAVIGGTIKLTDLDQKVRASVGSEIQKYYEENPQARANTPEVQQKLESAIEAYTNTKGLEAAAGQYRGIFNWTPTAWNERQNFIGNVSNLLSGLSLDALIKAKQEGATFGALSDSEMRILSSSASKLGAWATKDKSGNITGFKASESDVKKEIGNIYKILSGGINIDDAIKNTTLTEKEQSLLDKYNVK